MCERSAPFILAPVGDFGLHLALPCAPLVHVHQHKLQFSPPPQKYALLKSY